MKKSQRAIWKNVIVIGCTPDSDHIYELDEKGKLLMKIPRQKRRKLKETSKSEKEYAGSITYCDEKIGNDLIYDEPNDHFHEEYVDKTICNDEIDLSFLEDLEVLDDDLFLIEEIE